MKIKRYIAKNMSEACHLIKQDIGPDAVIVSSRKIREKGLKGLFFPRKLEVTAAVDEDYQQHSLKQEISQIKELLKSLPENPKNPKMDKKHDSFNEVLLGEIRSSLLQLEIVPEVVDHLLKDMDKEILPGGLVEIKQILLNRAISIFQPLMLKSTKQKIIAFVGPPGIGKTTTLAKLGAIYSLFESFKIGFITIDTYRIGAVEQIKIYGDIIGATVDIISSPEDLITAVEKNGDKDIILIDTAGTPSKNARLIAELKAYLDGLKNIDIYLVINATAKNSDLLRVLKDYKRLNYSGLVFTKIDETDTYGAILNAAYITKLPVVYITDGQNVPDDIEIASPELLAKLVLGDVDINV